MISVHDAQRLVTPEVRRRFEHDGYWVSPPLFDADEVARLVLAHDRLWAGEHDRPIPSQYGLTPVDPGSSKLRQQCNAWWVVDDIRWAVTHPVIGRLGSLLLDVPVVRMWTDQALYKPPVPGDGRDLGNNVGWHQDYGYWRAASTSHMVTAWIALQDTGPHNGCMRTLVGSHRWGTLADKTESSFWDQDVDRIRERFPDAVDEPCVIPAGAASFHHALTFHGSGPNRSDAPRRSLVSHMMPDGTCYRAGRQWHPNLVFLGPDARDGDPFAGPWFPVLWPPDGGVGQ